MTWQHRMVFALMGALAAGCGSNTAQSTSGAGGDAGGNGGYGGFGGFGGAGGQGEGAGGEASGGAGGGTITPISNACNDVCTDPAANPSSACGTCLGQAVQSGCGAATSACFADVSAGDCMSCSEYTTACDDGCPSLDVLCESSRDLVASLNTCLCDACSDAGTTLDTPGFTQCEHPPATTTACTGLDHTACVTTSGCHAIDGDPCAGQIDCTAYPKYSVCVSVAPNPVAGACSTLGEADCATREDCTSIRGQGPERCCAPPQERQPFLACVDERTPPAVPPNCIDIKMEGPCLTTDGCRPGYFAIDTIAGCGPYLTSLGETETHGLDWVGVCLPEW